MTTKNEKTVLARLKKMKRAELLFIMEQLLERKPDITPLMELLIELPSSPTNQQEKASSTSDKRTLDLVKIQMQVRTIIRSAIRRGSMESAYWAAAELGQVCEIGDSFADVGQWADAQAVYATVAEETITAYEALEDECQVAEVVDGCAHGLVLCLDTQRELPSHKQLDASNRKELLSSLFNIWQFEHDYGGITVDVADAVVRNVYDDERTWLEEWLQQKVKPDPDAQWSNRGILSFLARLTEKTLDI